MYKSSIINILICGDKLAIKTYSELIKTIEKKVRESLVDEVFDTVVDVEDKNIEKVKKKYTPLVYEWRTSGGLSDRSNIVYDKNKIKNGMLSVINITEPNSYARDGATIDKNLPELIEYGHGYKGYTYDYPGYPYSLPRPFTENTIEDLKSSKDHVESLKRGLTKRGLKVKG